MSAVAAMRKYMARRSTPAVVTFDVFDTVLLRLATPREVVVREVRHIAAALGLPGDVVADHRHAFARRQRDAYAAGYEAEWNVAEWLVELAADVGRPPEEIVDPGLAAHLEIERAATRPLAGVAELLADLSRQGVTTVALSDSWSPSESLRSLLEWHGLHFDHVISSGTEHVSKRRGTTFEPLCRRLGVDAGDILHVGDNWKADLLRPRRAGLRALLVPRRRFGPRSFRGPATVGHVADRVSRALDLRPDGRGGLAAVGREFLAPLLAAMALVQHRRFAADGIERVLFVARDGHLMHRAWEVLVGDDGPPSSYVRLSRRAVALAHPDDLLGTGAGLAGRFSHSSAAAFLGSFALDGAVADRLMASAKLQPDAPLGGAQVGALVAAIEQHADDIARARADVEELLREFLGPHLGGARRVGLVDSGWAGTTQDVIAHVLDVDRVHGVYLGVSALGREDTERSTKHGVLRDQRRPQPWMNAMDRTAGGIRVWDTVLREPHASVRRLVRVDGGVDVELDPATEPPPEQRAATGALIEGTLAGLEELKPGFRWLAADPDLSDDALEAYCCACAARVTVAPEPWVARALLSLRYEEADGSSWSLGWDAVTDGRAWYPGLASAAGLRPAARLMELAGRVLVRS